MADFTGQTLVDFFNTERGGANVHYEDAAQQFDQLATLLNELPQDQRQQQAYAITDQLRNAEPGAIGNVLRIAFTHWGGNPPDLSSLLKTATDQLTKSTGVTPPPAPTAAGVDRLGITDADVQAYVTADGKAPGSSSVAGYSKSLKADYKPTTTADFQQIADWKQWWYQNGDITKPYTLNSSGNPIHPETYGASPAQDQANLQLSMPQENVQAAYQQYVQGWQLQQQNARGLSDRPATSAQQQAQPKDFQSWVGSTLSAKYGLGATVTDRIAAYYSATYGEPMPDPLRAQLLSEIGAFVTNGLNVESGAVPEMIGLINAAIESGPYVSSPSGNPASPQAAAAGQNVMGLFAANSDINTKFPWINQRITDYRNKYPSQRDAQGEEVQNIQRVFMSTLGHPATGAQVDAMLGKSSEEMKSYMDNQIVSNGLTLGAYTDMKSRLINLGWTKYFGNDPSDPQIAMFAGRNDDDIKHWIGAQKSHLPNLTIDQYEGYAKTTDKLARQYYGYNDASFLHGVLHAEGKA